MNRTDSTMRYATREAREKKFTGPCGRLTGPTIPTAGPAEICGQPAGVVVLQPYACFHSCPPRLVPDQLADPVPGVGLHPLVSRPRYLSDVLHQRGVAGQLPGHVGRLSGRGTCTELPRLHAAAAGRCPGPGIVSGVDYPGERAAVHRRGGPGSSGRRFLRHGIWRAESESNQHPDGGHLRPVLPPGGLGLYRTGTGIGAGHDARAGPRAGLHH